MNGLALMTESDRESMMQMYEAAMPEGLKKMNIVVGKATIEEIVEERWRARRKREM